MVYVDRLLSLSRAIILRGFRPRIPLRVSDVLLLGVLWLSIRRLVLWLRRAIILRRFRMDSVRWSRNVSGLDIRRRLLRMLHLVLRLRGNIPSRRCLRSLIRADYRLLWPSLILRHTVGTSWLIPHPRGRLRCSGCFGTHVRSLTLFERLLWRCRIAGRHHLPVHYCCWRPDSRGRSGTQHACPDWLHWRCTNYLSLLNLARIDTNQILMYGSCVHKRVMRNDCRRVVHVLVDISHARYVCIVIDGSVVDVRHLGDADTGVCDIHVIHVARTCPIPRNPDFARR